MGLLSKILRWLGGSSAPQDDPPPEEESLEGVDSAEDETASEVVIYDENLYERARTQWQFGDWESLAQIEYESLIHHPQRARLALLVASAHQQRGDTDATREFTRLAQEWGASKKLVSQVLIAGVYNTLGKASALCGQQQRAIGHFEQSLRTAGDGGDVRLLAEARGGRQVKRNWSKEKSRSSSLQYLTHTGKQNKPNALIVLRGHANENSEAFALAFYPMEPKDYHLEGNYLKYNLKPGKPAYLVTNSNGNFESAPVEQQLHLEPESFYLISGCIAFDPPSSLMFWVFEYKDDKIIDKTSYACPDGKVEAPFRTGKGAIKVAFGLRLSGEGAINVEESTLNVDSGAIAEKRYEAYQKEIQQKQKAEEQRKTLLKLENFSRLQNYMGSDFLMPEMHGWPISPDLGVMLIRLIETEDYDAVIEFGSGVSTLIIAKALYKNVNNKNNLFLSFDHLEEFLNQTAGYLDRVGLKENVQLKLAPLQDYAGPDAKSYEYYSCIEDIENLKSQIHACTHSRNPKILVMVDGPPANSCEHARYPALPVLNHVFEDNFELHILMDDYIREDEREIVNEWMNWLQQEGMDGSKKEFLNMEKQACLVKIKKGIS
jgi:hypothetical protein